MARAIVDIGAHVGSFAVWAAQRSPKARILAVEPNPETFELLTQNIRHNRLDDRVCAVNAAVGVAAGTGSLELVAHSLGTRLAANGNGEVSVRVQTMPGLLAEAGFKQVDALKIDCEGMEYAVLEAMGPEGLRPIQTLACEYHPQPGRQVENLDALLRSAGFTVQRPEALLGVLWATR
jgi:FkbM family methyltransferase